MSAYDLIRIPRLTGRSLDEHFPPALGTVLVITLWRYICVPAFVIPIVYGFRLISLTKAYLQDPAFLRAFPNQQSDLQLTSSVLRPCSHRNLSPPRSQLIYLPSAPQSISGSSASPLSPPSPSPSPSPSLAGKCLTTLTSASFEDSNFLPEEEWLELWRYIAGVDINAVQDYYQLPVSVWSGFHVFHEEALGGRRVLTILHWCRSGTVRLSKSM